MAILFPTETVLPQFLAGALPGAGGARVRHRRQRLFREPAGHGQPTAVRSAGDAERSGAALRAARRQLQLRAPDRRAQAAWASFRLPAGSRVLDTGGYKGQSRELPMDAFYAGLSAALGVPREALHQHVRHDRAEHAVLRRRQCIGAVGQVGAALDPLAPGRPARRAARCARGERGMLVHCDLANFNSVTTILTEDVGIAVDGGFLLLGRAEGAQAKGCSLAVEEFMRAARHDARPGAPATCPAWRRASVQWQRLAFEPGAAARGRGAGADARSRWRRSPRACGRPAARHLKTLPVSRIIEIVDARRRPPARSAPTRTGSEADAAAADRHRLRRRDGAAGADGFLQDAFARRNCIASSPRTLPIRRCWTNSSRGRRAARCAPSARICWCTAGPATCPALPLWSLVCGLLVKAGNIGKLPSAEPVFAGLFARLLAEVHPPLADCLAVVWWKGGDEGQAAALFGAGRHRARLWRQRRASRRSVAQVPVTTRFLGTATSWASAWSAAARSTPARAPATARLAAHDVVRYDQQGCYSPHVFYVRARRQGVAARRSRSTWRAELANLQHRFPRRAAGAGGCGRRRRLASGGRVAVARRRRRRADRRGRRGLGRCLRRCRRRRWRPRRRIAASRWSRSTRWTRSLPQVGAAAALPADCGTRGGARRAASGSLNCLGAGRRHAHRRDRRDDGAGGRLASRRPLQPAGPGAHGGDRAVGRTRGRCARAVRGLGAAHRASSPCRRSASRIPDGRRWCATSTGTWTKANSIAWSGAAAAARPPCSNWPPACCTRTRAASPCREWMCSRRAATSASCSSRPTLLEWLRVLDNVLLPVSLQHRATRDRRSTKARATAGAARPVGARTPLPAPAVRRPAKPGRAGARADPRAGAAAAGRAVCRPRCDHPRRAAATTCCSYADCAGTTVLFVTHDITEAVYLADRVAVDGRRSHRRRTSASMLPRPRTSTMRYDAAFNGICARLRQAMDTASA